jgi:hypothetical protein
MSATRPGRDRPITQSRPPRYEQPRRRTDVKIDELLERLDPIHGVARGGFGDGTGNVWAETGAIANSVWADWGRVHWMLVDAAKEGRVVQHPVSSSFWRLPTPAERGTVRA